MNKTICLLLLSMSALAFAAARSSSEEDSNTFEKADADHLWPLLFLVAGGTSPMHSVAVLTTVCGVALAVLGIIYHGNTLGI